MNVTSPYVTPGGTSGALSPGAASAGLQGQLAKCETQSSDWVHCVSADKPEGKAKIQALSNRVDALKLKIDQTAAAKAERVQALAPESTSPLALGIGSLGSLVDVFA